MEKIDEILNRLDKQEKKIDQIQKRVFVIETKKSVETLDDGMGEWLLALFYIVLFIMVLLGLGYLFRG
ncbi:hypothetical protein KKG24_04640 [Patescibacteria group bacterium]|nr:hypothetical protein [Patescibacteria group bacterium]